MSIKNNQSNIVQKFNKINMQNESQAFINKLFDDVAQITSIYKKAN